jgi:hypothetical protein
MRAGVAEKMNKIISFTRTVLITLFLLFPASSWALDLSAVQSAANNWIGNSDSAPYQIQPGRKGFWLSEAGKPNDRKWYYYNQELPDESVLDQLTPQQNNTLFNHCEKTTPGVYCAPLILTTSEQELISARASEEAGGVALKLFNYSMGQTQNSDGTVNKTCITCTFLGNFMIGLTNFSYATYSYFEQAFVSIVPILMAIWVAWKTIALFSTGGEDGRSYIYSVLRKMALFFFVWAAITVGNTTATLNTSDYGMGRQSIQIDNPKWAWDTVGPDYLSVAFGLSSEIRDYTIQRRANIQVSDFEGGASYDAFRCIDVGQNMSKYTSDATILKFATNATEVACATERTHMIGVSSALAVLGSANSQIEWSPKSWASFIIKLISGFFMLFVFGLSAIWFTFLILDVAVRGLITAAFLPVIATMYLFEVTRGFSTSAFRALVGAMVTAVAISIVSTLAFYLLTRTVLVYNQSIGSMSGIYGFQLEKIPTGDAIEAFRQFIIRIQQSKANEPQIPMDFSSPWFYYLVLSALAIFSLGKKIIAMLEGMVGAQGASAMADNAMKLSRSGLGLAMPAGAIAGTGLLFAGRGGITGLAWSGGAGSEVLKKINPFGNNAGGGGIVDNAANATINAIQSSGDIPSGE